MQVDFQKTAHLAARVALILLMIGTGWDVFQRLVAQHFADEEAGIDGISKALTWEPDYPDYHFRYGLAMRDLPSGQDLALAEKSLERAVDLNPFAWRYWIELARCYDLRQNRVSAEKAYLKAIELNPRSGEFYWRVANSHLRWGERERALEEIGSTLKWDRSFRSQALDLLKRSEFPLEEIEKIWPSDQNSQLHLINYFVSNPVQSPEERGLLSDCWTKLLLSESPPSIAQGSFYVGQLSRAAPLEARDQWIRLLRINGVEDADYETLNNQVWNGHFETELFNGPFDWQFHPSDNSEITRVRGEGLGGSTALRIDFRGIDNSAFSNVRVNLLTGTGGNSSLSFKARSRDISSDEGLYFQIIESATGRVLVESTKILGTTPWTDYEECFRTPAEPMFAQLELRRNPSQKIDNRLSGTVWIDEVSVRDY